VAHITKAFVESAEVPPEGQHEIFYWDGSLKGFGLRVTDTGFKSFVWQGRLKSGRMRRLTIRPDCRYLSVAQARVKWMEIKTLAANGTDPTLERRRERQAPTFGDICESYCKEAESRGVRSIANSRQRLENDCPRWRNRKASEITRDEVARLQDKIGEERGQVTANRTACLIRRIFNHALDRGLISCSNPATRVKLFHEEARTRFLSVEELARVNAALAAEPNEYWRACFPLLLLLGPRRGDLLSARWSDFNLDAKTWRIPTAKTGREHLLPLPEGAVAILRSLPSLHSSPWVFPGPSRSGHLRSPRKAWDRIRRAAKVEDCTIHDLRRTLGSWLASEGHSLPLIGRVLGHQAQSSTQIYARLALDPVRKALEANAKLMLGANGFTEKDDEQ
jgi:integrase